MNEHRLLKNEKSATRSPEKPNKSHPDRPPSGPPLFSCSWTSLLILFFLGLGSLFILPRFEKIFGEFSAELPLFTKILLNPSLPYTLIALSLISFMLIILTKNKAFAALALMVAVLYIVCLIFALYQPIVSMTETLSG